MVHSSAKTVIICGDGDSGRSSWVEENLGVEGTESCDLGLDCTFDFKHYSFRRSPSERYDVYDYVGPSEDSDGGSSVDVAAKLLRLLRSLGTDVGLVIFETREENWEYMEEKHRIFLDAVSRDRCFYARNCNLNLDFHSGDWWAAIKEYFDYSYNSILDYEDLRRYNSGRTLSYTNYASTDYDSETENELVFTVAEHSRILTFRLIPEISQFYTIYPEAYQDEPIFLNVALPEPDEGSKTSEAA